MYLKVNEKDNCVAEVRWYINYMVSAVRTDTHKLSTHYNLDNYQEYNTTSYYFSSK
jgi:hypothetical protein